MIRIGTVFSGIGAPEHALQRLGISHKIEFACDTGDVDIFSRKMAGTYDDTKKAFDEIHTLIEEFVPSDEYERSFISGLQSEVYELELEFNRFQPNVGKKELRSLNEMFSMKFEKINTQRIKQELSRIESYDEKKKYVDSLYAPYAKRNMVRTTYMANYPITDEQWNYNVCFMDGTQWKNKIDLFVGGSPCQSFSVCGKRRGLADTRGTLFFEFARLVSEIQPKAFIYENVKNLITHDGGNTWETMKAVFDEIGYDYYWKVLNAKDYGVPQNRKRVFVVGIRHDISLKKEFEFPNPVPLETTMKDYLLDHVSGKYFLTKNQVKFVDNEERLRKRYVQIDGDIALCQLKCQQVNLAGDFVFVEENKDMEKTMQDLDKYFLSEKLVRYVMDENRVFVHNPQTDTDIACTLLKSMHKMHRAGIDNYVHTQGRLRKLTPRECFRLMGFSDSFKIPVSDTAAYMQSGNSIVVDVLMHILNSMIKTGCFGDDAEVENT